MTISTLNLPYTNPKKALISLKGDPYYLSLTAPNIFDRSSSSPQVIALTILIPIPTTIPITTTIPISIAITYFYFNIPIIPTTVTTTTTMST